MLELDDAQYYFCFKTFGVDKSQIDEFIKWLQENHPEFVYNSEKIRKIIQLFRVGEDDEITVVVEKDYVDMQHRDSYYEYFSQKYDKYERNCIRLIFWGGKVQEGDFRGSKGRLQEKLIGSMVLRPLGFGNIGNTLLDFSKLKIKGLCRTGHFKIRLLGQEFVIPAFPFSTQDARSMTCAETALFHLTRYYGERYSCYRALMASDIHKYMEEIAPERVLPSKGLEPSQVAKVLSSEHFYPRMYSKTDYNQHINESKESKLNDDVSHTINRVVHYYAESGAPTLILTKDHAMVCIGYGAQASDLRPYNHRCDKDNRDSAWIINTADTFKQYIVVDDNELPYDLCPLRKEKGCESIVEYLVVPLYRRIFMDATAAAEVIYSLLRNTYFIQQLRSAVFDGDSNWGRMENPIVYRMFLITSNRYKNYKNEHTSGPVLRQIILETPMPKFVWVIELSDLENYHENKALAEIVLDATASSHDHYRGIFSIGYHKHFLCVPMANNSPGGLKIGDSKNLSSKNRRLTAILDSVYNSCCSFYPRTLEMFKGILEGVHCESNE